MPEPTTTPTDTPPLSALAPTDSLPSQPSPTNGTDAPPALSTLIAPEYAERLAKFGQTNDLAKAYVDLETKFSSQNRIEIPTQDSTDEDRAAFWNKLGRPEAADAYTIPPIPDDFAVKERPEEQLQGFLKMAHEEGFSDKQAARAVEWWTGTTNQMHLDTLEGMRTAAIETEALLKKEWADAYDQRVGMAKDAITTFDLRTETIPEGEFRQALIESGMTNDPRVIRYLAAVGRNLAEDVFHRGGTGPITIENSPKEAQDKLAALRKDPEWRDAFANKLHPKHEEVLAQHKTLHAEAYPETEPE